MNKKNDGGPAFPRVSTRIEHTNGEVDLFEGYEGMSLRDYFAAKVLPEVYCRAVQTGNDSQESICQEAYELADTMIEARER